MRDQLPFMKRIIMKCYPRALKSYNFVQEHWRATILFKISTLLNLPVLSSLQRVTCFILRVDFFQKHSLLYFFKFVHNMFWDNGYKWLKTIFLYRYWFKNNNFPFYCKVSHFPYFQYSLNRTPFLQTTSGWLLLNIC